MTYPVPGSCATCTPARLSSDSPLPFCRLSNEDSGHIRARPYESRIRQGQHVCRCKKSDFAKRRKRQEILVARDKPIGLTIDCQFQKLVVFGIATDPQVEVTSTHSAKRANRLKHSWRSSGVA
jgi:hypothetical protein